MDEAEKITVVVCMGSSCFSRGNNRLLQQLQDYIRHNGFEDKINLTGSLCEDCCTCGPTVTINGIRCSAATPETCMQLLAGHLEKNACPEAEPLS